MNISGTLKYLKCGTLSIDLQEITQWVYDPATMYTMRLNTLYSQIRILFSFSVLQKTFVSSYSEILFPSVYKAKLSRWCSKYLQEVSCLWLQKYSPATVLFIFLHCNPVQGQYRARTGFSLWSFSHREKPVFITGNPFSHCRDPVFITGISLWEKLRRENPVFITRNGFAVWPKSGWACAGFLHPCTVRKTLFRIFAFLRSPSNLKLHFWGSFEG